MANRLVVPAVAPLLPGARQRRPKRVGLLIRATALPLGRGSYISCWRSCISPDPVQQERPRCRSVREHSIAWRHCAPPRMHAQAWKCTRRSGSRLSNDRTPACPSKCSSGRRRWSTFPRSSRLTLRSPPRLESCCRMRLDDYAWLGVVCGIGDTGLAALAALDVRDLRCPRAEVEHVARAQHVHGHPEHGEGFLLTSFRDIGPGNVAAVDDVHSSGA